jgi:hypothetical protein
METQRETKGVHKEFLRFYLPLVSVDLLFDYLDEKLKGVPIIPTFRIYDAM